MAVIGPNGSGKSTLFNVITGLVEAEAGSIRFHGEEIIGLPPHEILVKGIARPFQNLRLLRTCNVSAAAHFEVVDGFNRKAVSPGRFQPSAFVMPSYPKQESMPASMIAPEPPPQFLSWHVGRHHFYTSHKPPRVGRNEIRRSSELVRPM